MSLSELVVSSSDLQSTMYSMNGVQFHGPHSRLDLRKTSTKLSVSSERPFFSYAVSGPLDSPSYVRQFLDLLGLPGDWC